MKHSNDSEKQCRNAHPYPPENLMADTLQKSPEGDCIKGGAMPARFVAVSLLAGSERQTYDAAYGSERWILVENRMIRLALIIMILLRSMISQAQAGSCNISKYRTGLDYPEVTARLVVTRNATCGSQLKSRFQPGVVKTYHSFSITVKPTHGIAGKTKTFLWAYKPFPGYIGPDRFQFEIFFDENGSPGSTKVDVDVNVTDG